MKKIFFTIIIPVLKINRYITQETLPALTGLDSNEFEVIILPNQVTKEGKKLTRQYNWLRLIPTNKITRPAQKRDLGAEKAKGQILAFIDDDAFPSSDWLTRAKRVIQEKKVEAVCGPGVLPKSTNLWEKVFDEVLKTWLGSGGLSYRFTPKAERFVDDYPSMNFLIEKKVFDKIGGFNSNYWPGEDSKLCEDLVYKLRGRIFYSPNVIIYHHRRDKLFPYLKQHGQYGYHRGAFFAQGDRNSRRPVYLIPSLFVLYLIMLPFLYQIFNLSLLPLALYFILLMTIFLPSLRNTNNLKIASFSTIVLFLMHVVYGVKFIKGFLVGIIKKEKIY